MVISGGTLNNAGAGAALGDANAAATFLRGVAVTQDLTGSALGGRVLKAGVYKFATEAGLDGTLILDAENNDNAVFIFDIGTELTTGPNAKVFDPRVLEGGGAVPAARGYPAASRKQCCATSEARRPSRRWSGVNLVHTGAAR